MLAINVCIPDSMRGAWELDWLMEWERRFRRKEGKGRTDSSGQTDINIPWRGQATIRQLICSSFQGIFLTGKNPMHVLTARYEGKGKPKPESEYIVPFCLFFRTLGVQANYIISREVGSHRPNSQKL